MKLSKDILEELSGISPVIANIERKNVFTPPPVDYFETFPDSVKYAVAEDPVLQIGLDSKNNDLQAPDAGYFEGFAAKVLKKVSEENHSTPVRKMPRKNSFIRYTAIAAILTIGVFIYFNLSRQQTVEKTVAVEKITPDSSFSDEEWFANNAADLDHLFDLSDTQVKHMLNTVSLEELEDYDRYNPLLGL